MSRAIGFSDYIEALPARIGYELHTEATVTLLNERGEVIVVGVLPDGIAAQTVIDGVAQVRDECQRAAQTVALALVTTHSPTATTLDHRLRAARVQGLLADAGIDCPVNAWAVGAGTTWPVDDPAWTVPVTGDGRYTAEMVLHHGPPAPSQEEAGAAYHPVAGPLRDALADTLPEAAAQERDHAASWGGALWRRATVTATINRLSDPQPLTGAQASTLLLGLSDPRVRDLLITHTIAAARGLATDSPDPVMAPDPGHLSDLVRHAPPGLIAGPAAVLGAALFAGGHPPVNVRAAAAAALQDDPGCTVARVLGEASTQRREPVLHDLGQARPVGVADQTPPTFTTHPDCWPDPLAGHPVTGFDPLVDPLAGPADPLSGNGGSDIEDWWGGLDDGPEVGR